MSTPESLLMAAVAVFMFGYFVMAFAILTRGSGGLPRWVRPFFNTDELAHKPWPLRALGMPWVLFWVGASLFVALVGLDQADGWPGRIALIVALLLMAGWAGYLWVRYRRMRS